ncbi:uncharacterized protein TNCV_1684651 [Trichonephila clavipes]|nr:uncharacterized protein TNCV_1684651 [Trichonephila clavipes]
METSGWSTRRVAGQLDRSECAVRNSWEQLTREVLTRGKPGLERPGKPRGETIEGSGAKPDECGMSQIGKRLCLVMNPGLFWGQMITVYGRGGTLTYPWPAHSPDLSPVEHGCYQLKRQMPLCHSVHDLELDVQDLLAHLPQDNIRCLINSMPNLVAACTAAGYVPTRY